MGKIKPDNFKSQKLNFIKLRYLEDIEDCIKIDLHEKLIITAIKNKHLLFLRYNLQKFKILEK